MKNSKILFQELINSITLDEDENEVASLVYLIMEAILHVTKAQILSEKVIEVNEGVREKLKNIVNRINQHEPVQYILGEAFFFGRRFKVTGDVLIPRPETEELVLIVKKWLQSSKKPKPKILDIGTGSGCIPITLNLEIKDSEVYATDVSEEALAVAKFNAANLEADVTFVQHNILNEALNLSDVDVIVSNPPYIAPMEKQAMKKNVLNYEPHLALFASDDDPLEFYKAIASKSFIALKRKGLVAVEINERYGKQVASLFSINNFQRITIVKDLFQKERFVTAIKD